MASGESGKGQFRLIVVSLQTWRDLIYPDLSGQDCHRAAFEIDKRITKAVRRYPQLKSLGEQWFETFSLFLKYKAAIESGFLRKPATIVALADKIRQSADELIRRFTLLNVRGASLEMGLRCTQ